MEANPYDATILRTLLELYEQQGQADRARALTGRILAERPEDPELYFWIGDLAIDQGDFATASRAFETMVEVDSLSAEGWTNAAYAYLRLEQPDRAAALLEQGRELLPKEVRILRLLALAYRDLERPDDAIAALETAADIEPENHEIRYELAETLEKASRYDEAKALFEEIVAQYPDNIDYLFGLASCVEQSGDFEAAVAHFEILLQKDPDNALALNYLGYIFAEKGIRLQEAAQMLERAVAQEPENGAFLDSLGWAYYKLGRLLGSARVP